jgi:nucleotide-binding universal stress UspA family protein
MLSNLKNILVGVTHEINDDNVFSALPYSLSLAGTAGAHMTVQAASLKLILTSPFVTTYAAGLVAAENRRLLALAEAAAEQGRQEAQAAGLSCTVEANELTYSELLATFTGQARVHDLTILDAEPVAVALDRGLIEAVLTGSGRPLIVVPKGQDQFKSRRVVIAWDGSANAARAVNDALPFLRAAEAVDVVSVIGEKDLSRTVPGAEIARHLTRHGVVVSVTSLEAVDGDVAETLRRHAALFQADLLVMGGFVHSRLRQMVFGGVTQSLLTTCAVPLFLSY